MPDVKGETGYGLFDLVYDLFWGSDDEPTKEKNSNGDGDDEGKNDKGGKRDDGKRVVSFVAADEGKPASVAGDAGGAAKPQ